jgi:hypothetical protein
MYWKFKPLTASDEGKEVSQADLQNFYLNEQVPKINFTPTLSLLYGPGRGDILGYVLSSRS